MKIKVLTVIGFYLHIRCFLSYTLCMSRRPPTMRDKKREKIKYERLRELVIKERPSDLTASDIECLQMMRSDYGGLEKELVDLK